MDTFTHRKPNVTREWQQKLPDFVRRLEETLYRNAVTKARAPGRLGDSSARSPRGTAARVAVCVVVWLQMLFKCLASDAMATQEEYSNLETLEQRLQHVAKRMVGPGGRQQGEVNSGPFSALLAVPAGTGPLSPVDPEGAGDHHGGSRDLLGGVKAEHRAPSGAVPGAPSAGHHLPGAGLFHGAHAAGTAGIAGYKLEGDAGRAAGGAGLTAGAETGSLRSPGVALQNGGHFRAADAARFDTQARPSRILTLRTPLPWPTPTEGAARAVPGKEVTGSNSSHTFPSPSPRAPASLSTHLTR